MRAKSGLKPKRLVQRRRRASAWRVAAVLFVMVAAAGGFAALLRAPALAIKGVEVRGASVLDKAALAAAAASVLQGNFAGLLPKGNILTYPREGLRAELAGRFKRIGQISLKMEKGNILALEIKEREGKYLWCGTEPSLSGECFFADGQGYIFDRAPSFSGNAYFKIYGPLDSSLNFQILSPAEFTRLTEFKEQLENIKLAPTYLWLKDGGQCLIRAAAGFEIFFLCDADLAKLAGDLNTTFQAEPFLPDYPEKISKLLYLDLRHENKVFYKFR